jgi:hypothetical protein
MIAALLGNDHSIGFGFVNIEETRTELCINYPSETLLILFNRERARITRSVHNLLVAR